MAPLEHLGLMRVNFSRLLQLSRSISSINSLDSVQPILLSKLEEKELSMNKITEIISSRDETAITDDNFSVAFDVTDDMKFRITQLVIFGLEVKIITGIFFCVSAPLSFDQYLSCLLFLRCRMHVSVQSMR